MIRCVPERLNYIKSCKVQQFSFRNLQKMDTQCLVSQTHWTIDSFYCFFFKASLASLGTGILDHLGNHI